MLPPRFLRPCIDLLLHRSVSRSDSSQQGLPAGTSSARRDLSISGAWMCPSKESQCWRHTSAVRPCCLAPSRLRGASLACCSCCFLAHPLSFLDCHGAFPASNAFSGVVAMASIALPLLPCPPPSPGMLIALIAHHSAAGGGSSECGWYAVAFVFGGCELPLLLRRLACLAFCLLPSLPCGCCPVVSTSATALQGHTGPAAACRGRSLSRRRRSLPTPIPLLLLQTRPSACCSPSCCTEPR
jgi:hypothetical protein